MRSLNIVFFPRLLFQANSTFNALAKLKELADLWDELGPRVWDFLQDSSQVNAMRVRLCTERQYNNISLFFLENVGKFNKFVTTLIPLA